jgi:hypothetical protein
MSIDFISWDWKVEKKNFSFEKKSFFWDASLFIQMRYDEKLKDSESYLLMITFDRKCKDIIERCRDSREECKDIQRDVNLFAL